MKLSGCCTTESWSPGWRPPWGSSPGGTARRWSSLCAPRCPCRNTTGKAWTKEIVNALFSLCHRLIFPSTSVSASWGWCLHTWRTTVSCARSSCVSTAGRRARLCLAHRPPWCCWIPSMGTWRLWVHLTINPGVQIWWQDWGDTKVIIFRLPPTLQIPSSSHHLP